MNCHDVVAALPATVFSGELVGWIDGSARRLIQHAARNAPPSLSERLEEEWLADLAARRGSMSRLRLAIGCCWAMRAITYDHCATGVPAASSATGNKVMTAYTRHDSALSSRRSIALLLIVCLHVALIYSLATGLVHTVAAVIPTVIHATVTTEVRPRENPPPPRQPQLGSTVVEIPEPYFRFDLPADPKTIRDVATEQPPRRTSEPSIPRVMSRVLGGPGKGFPNTADYYPPASIRFGEKGIAAVRVCVDGNGRLSADPTIAQSSGSARLDEGALRLAKAGSGHYRATTEDGRSVNSCFPFLIRFEFRD
jgi:TonB family protein